MEAIRAGFEVSLVFGVYMILIYLGYMMIVSDPWSESYGLCIKLEIKKLNSPTGAFLYCPFPFFIYLYIYPWHPVILI